MQKKKKITLTIEPILIKEAKIRAIQEDTSVSQAVEDLLQAWLANELTIDEILTKLRTEENLVAK